MSPSIFSLFKLRLLRYAVCMSVPELVPTGNQGELRSPWVAAPASSHVAAFRFYDRSGTEFGASSEIWVTFKSSGKSQKPPQTYKYKFSSHDTAKQVWADLCGSANPGEVVHSELKQRGVPYDGPFYADLGGGD